MAAPKRATEILSSEWSRKFADAASNEIPYSEWSRKFAAAAAAVAANSGTEILAATVASYPDSVRRRKLAVAAAITAAIEPNPEILANTEILAAQAAIFDTECHGKFPIQAANVVVATAAQAAFVATAAQAAFVDKIEGYYLELARKLFELRFFAVEKDAMAERLQKEKDAITERFQKEKDAITERLQKEKDAIIERLQKENDEITERLQKKKRTRRSLRA